MCCGNSDEEFTITQANGSKANTTDITIKVDKSEKINFDLAFSTSKGGEPAGCDAWTAFKIVNLTEGEGTVSAFGSYLKCETNDQGTCTFTITFDSDYFTQVDGAVPAYPLPYVVLNSEGNEDDKHSKKLDVAKIQKT